MLVSCPSCSAKFNVPDAKIAGKRARMKCKKCSAAIPLDGTHLAPAPVQPASNLEAEAKKKRTRSAPRRPPTSNGISTRWRVSEPSGKEHEMSLADVARTYSQGGFEPGTLVCAPGKDDWLPPYDHPQVMDMALPSDELDPPRPPQPTFSENTVTLGAEESAKLTRAAARENATARSGAGNSFFENDDVDHAMDAFDNIVSLAPGNANPNARPSPVQLKNVPAGRRSVPAPRASAPQEQSAPTPSPARGKRRSVPPPSSRRPSVPAPSRSPSRPPSPGSSLARNNPGSPLSSQPPASSTRPPMPRRTSSPVAPPPSHRAAPIPPSPSQRPPGPSYAPAPSYPPAASAATSYPPPAPSAPPPYSAPPYSRPGGSSVPTAPPNSALTAPSFAPTVGGPRSTSAPPYSAPPPHSSPSQTYQSAALSEPTFGTITAPPSRQKSSSGLLPLFLAVVLVLGALAGIYLFRPALFQRGMHRIQTLIGLKTDESSPQKAEGPPFDAQAAGEVLGQIAAEAAKCREPGGPVGKGRAQVLYSTDGSASSVAVSRPFHETSVGSCLQEMFKKTRVPAFGGDPVVVSKTFDVQ